MTNSPAWRDFDGSSPNQYPSPHHPDLYGARSDILLVPIGHARVDEWESKLARQYEKPQPTTGWEAKFEAYKNYRENISRVQESSGDPSVPVPVQKTPVQKTLGGKIKDWLFSKK